MQFHPYSLHTWPGVRMVPGSAPLCLLSIPVLGGNVLKSWLATGIWEMNELCLPGAWEQLLALRSWHDTSARAVSFFPILLTFSLCRGTEYKPVSEQTKCAGGYLRVFLQYIHFNDIEWNYGVLFQKRQQWRPEMCLEYVLWRHWEKPRKAEVRTFEQLTVVLNSCMTASSCITAQTLKKCVDHFL